MGETGMRSANTSAWFYEYAGEKCGPVSQCTIAHLAKHGAIGAHARIWTDDGGLAVAAEELAWLRPHLAALDDSSRGKESADRVRSVLARVLDAVRNHAVEELGQRSPPIVLIASCFDGTAGVALIDYRVIAVEQVAPEVNGGGAGSGMTAARFNAVVRASVCKRKSWRATVEELQKSGTDKRDAEFVFECIERKDGSWHVYERIPDRLLPPGNARPVA